MSLNKGLELATTAPLKQLELPENLSTRVSLQVRQFAAMALPSYLILLVLQLAF